jgi:hypothetical protein
MTGHGLRAGGDVATPGWRGQPPVGVSRCSRNCSRWGNCTMSRARMSSPALLPPSFGRGTAAQERAALHNKETSFSHVT